MKYLSLTILTIIILASCSTNSQLIYLKDSNKFVNQKINLSYLENEIAVGDILKIEVKSLVSEAVIPYNKIERTQNLSQNLQLLQLEGYLVSNLNRINFPVLGSISTKGLNLHELENKITELLLNENHLINPTVNIRRLNSKFTVLGEVKNPGTFSYIDEKLNLFQALGYAGDLTIDGKRKDLTLIREVNGERKVFKIELTKSDLLNKSIYQIMNNDVIIVNPSFNKVKSAGFIGSPSSIASITSLLLSITLLIINN